LLVGESPKPMVVVLIGAAPQPIVGPLVGAPAAVVSPWRVQGVSVRLWPWAAR
jgi:hypothetical protein